MHHPQRYLIAYTTLRPSIKGKFLYVGEEKLWVKGVTYGTFRPDEANNNFPAQEVIEKDFALMQKSGVNCLRTYTVPPLNLLDTAQQYGLRVLVGLPWEQHIAFLDEPGRAEQIVRKLQEDVSSCGGHPAILAFTLGNEIPAPIVRWHGKKKIENFLKRLYHAGKQADPGALFTYVNYPTTEYLDLSFTDFDCFNVYLETKEKLDAYLKRLHNLIGDRPLVMAEIGLDSMRNGEDTQAEILDWQIRSIFSSGCSGAFVFAWTDEWWRGGYDIEDWDFGLTRRDRSPKPALEKVSKAFAESPFPITAQLPKVSVVCCSYNGSATIRETLEASLNLEYHDYEIIVINDGSTDNLRDIVEEYPVRLFNTPNRGLSSARNLGMEMATGEIVVYIDDDAYPDKNWLQYLAHAFMTTNHAGVGGPNIPPQGDGLIAECVANAPGGPVHVLLTDQIAEHIPGCNMAFRRDALLDVGGCDPRYRTAGDDVDLCWRLQEKGYTIGFHPSAVVWHHRRNSVFMYWKQQIGYGKAEALLEQKWPAKYNCFGHLAWAGRIYGNGLTKALQLKKERVFHGTWGTGLFQSIYQAAPKTLASMPLMPEWYFLIIGLAFLSVLGFFWKPLLFFVPIFLASFLVIFVQAGMSASRSVYSTARLGRKEKLKRWLITTLLHIVQPLARLYGRLRNGLTLWRKRGELKTPFGYYLLSNKTFELWSETWKPAESWLKNIEAQLNSLAIGSRRGGDYDRWDLETQCGLFGSCRALLTLEEHGAGKQFVKLKCRPRISVVAYIFILAAIALTTLAIWDAVCLMAIIFGAAAFTLIWKTVSHIAKAMHNLASALLLQEANPEESATYEIDEPMADDNFEEPMSDIATAKAYAATAGIGSSKFREIKIDPVE